jgi:hypothetical protein
VLSDRFGGIRERARAGTSAPGRPAAWVRLQPSSHSLARVIGDRQAAEKADLITELDATHTADYSGDLSTQASKPSATGPGALIANRRCRATRHSPRNPQRTLEPSG